MRQIILTERSQRSGPGSIKGKVSKPREQKKKIKKAVRPNEETAVRPGKGKAVLMNMADKYGKNQIEPSGTGQTEAPEAERRLGLSMLTRVALAVVVLVSLIISISCVMTFNQLEAQKAELQAQVDAYNREIDELQYLINAPVDDEYIARVARERLKLHFPDEFIYRSDVND